MQAPGFCSKQRLSSSNFFEKWQGWGKSILQASLAQAWQILTVFKHTDSLGFGGEAPLHVGPNLVCRSPKKPDQAQIQHLIDKVRVGQCMMHARLQRLRATRLHLSCQTQKDHSRGVSQKSGGTPVPIQRRSSLGRSGSLGPPIARLGLHS